MRRQDVLIALPFIFLLAVPFVSDSQLIRGVVSGTVTATGNAVISGVQVTLTNTSTNISRQTVTNDLGIYRFVAVEPGEYSAEFIFSGFETARIANLTIRTDLEGVHDETLRVGA